MSTGLQRVEKPAHLIPFMLLFTMQGFPRLLVRMGAFPAGAARMNHPSGRCLTPPRQSLSHRNMPSGCSYLFARRYLRCAV